MRSFSHPRPATQAAYARTILRRRPHPVPSTTSDEGALERVYAQLHELIELNLAHRRTAEGLAERIANLDRVRQIWELAAFFESTPVGNGPLVSVITATRDRAELLPRAVASVVAQTYGSWELIVVDDGGRQSPIDALAEVEDRRVRVVRQDHRGVAGARNCGLREAKGNIVAYLDDDNLMHPQWLRAVAWAFTRWRDVDVVYGATVVDDDVTRDQGDPPGLPWVRFSAWDDTSVRIHNPSDISSIAHRRELPEAVFDEELVVFEDWDLLIRLSQRRRVRALPAIAGVYSTEGDDRLSISDAWRDAWDVLRAKHDLEAVGIEAAPRS